MRDIADTQSNPLRTRSLRTLCARTVVGFVLVAGSALAESPAEPRNAWYVVPAPDQSNWSETRIRGYAQSRALDSDVPEAVLSVPALNLHVPVYYGTDRRVMELGAGWVEGTAVPGGDGNVVLAAHRDSYFRELGRVVPRSEIVLRTETGERRYVVAETRIVDPLDVEVLEDGGEPLLTLITCYPFYYAGHAPDRFVVRARLITEDAPPAVAAQ